MTTFDKFYAWCFPVIPSRDKIFAKLVELKVEQEKARKICPYSDDGKCYAPNADGVIVPTDWTAHEGCCCNLCEKARKQL